MLGLSLQTLPYHKGEAFLPPKRSDRPLWPHPSFQELAEPTGLPGLEGQPELHCFLMHMGRHVDCPGTLRPHTSNSASFPIHYAQSSALLFLPPASPPLSHPFFFFFFPSEICRRRDKRLAEEGPAQGGPMQNTGIGILPCGPGVQFEGFGQRCHN